MADICMSMGRREKQPQSEFWAAARELPRSPGHPFYQQLNQRLDAGGFDRFCEEACRKFYAERMGRPSIPPGMYFRMLMVGYFEKIDSEKGIAWRCCDSLRSDKRPRRESNPQPLAPEASALSN